LSASVEGKRIEPVPELSGIGAYSSKRRVNDSE